MDWLTDLKNWLLGIIRSLWEAWSGFYHDMSLQVIKTILSAVGEIAKVIPVPQWMADYSVGRLLGQLDPSLGYFVDRIGLGAGLTLLGLGYAFRVSRKMLTAFQW
ncbi:hypothetical protein [Frateuria sp. YIM B11624]|uniref:hypothetical protein n=1 Tax=Frateuria sp. YIM B11624 TaxID=3143185 RepID=UPI003C78A4DF